MPQPFKYSILFAEDNPNDVLFMKRAIRRGRLPFILHHVINGEEAISYMLGDGSYGDRDRYPLPSLLISNIKMPRVSGLQLLQWVRQQPAWHDLPVVVLSSSNDPGEAGQFEQLGANLYFVKPVDLNQLVTNLQEIVALLPPPV